MSKLPLQGKTVLVTGGARRIGKALSLAIAHAGGDVIIHYCSSLRQAEQTAQEIEAMGRHATLLQADLSEIEHASSLIERAFAIAPLFALVNNAAVFEPLTLETTDLSSWERHMHINLTSPFFLSQAFARLLPLDREGRIVNILDWRALRPRSDHLPYTITKAALAALTRALAIVLAPHITVNGMALGAVLPPASLEEEKVDEPIRDLPLPRWAELSEVEELLIFLLSGPDYITGEIIHLDGGRHLV